MGIVIGCVSRIGSVLVSGMVRPNVIAICFGIGVSVVVVIVIVIDIATRSVVLMVVVIASWIFGI